MGYYEETREIYVKVNSKEDYDTVKKIFEKYEISTECINDIKVIYNVYVYMDEDDFQEFRYEIYEAVADCLVLATCDKYHSVGGSCGYEIFSHYPNQEDWDEHYLCDDENSCPVGVYGINDLKSCLDFIHRAQLKLDVASKVAIYKIWGENIDEESFTAVENDDSAETFLKSLIINNPVTVGNLSRKSKTIYRLCAIAKDDEIMQLIKNGIKECVNKGDEIVSKATYIPDKQMMYFVAADFYESDYQGKIEYAVNDLLEKAKGKFIILVDCFVAYNEDDYYSEEGYAECSLGSDMKYFSWDCCTYDEEMEDNFDVNITDVLGYLNTYGFEMEYDEKVFISSFKYDNDSDIPKIQSALHSCVIEAESSQDISDWTEDYPMTKSIEGTGYVGRAARIEFVKVGDPLILKADYDNAYYWPVAIEVFNAKNETLGYLREGYDADSLEEIAKHLDKLKARVASVTPLSMRSKRAKYALLDVELYL